MLKKISYITLGISVILLAVIFIGDFAFNTTSATEACSNLKDSPMFCDDLTEKKPSIWLIIVGVLSFGGFVCLVLGGNKEPKKSR